MRKIDAGTGHIIMSNDIRDIKNQRKKNTLRDTVDWRVKVTA